MRNNTTNGELYDSYKIQTRDDTTDDSHEEIETIRVCKAASPITRRHLRRKAFRRKPSGSTEVYPIIDHSDTVDSLNQLLDTDFAREARWSNDNPVYNEVAGARIDSTLKRSCITYTSLTQTLQKQSVSKSADHLHEPSACNDCSLSPSASSTTSPCSSHAGNPSPLHLRTDVAAQLCRLLLPRLLPVKCVATDFRFQYRKVAVRCLATMPLLVAVMRVTWSLRTWTASTSLTIVWEHTRWRHGRALRYTDGKLWDRSRV